MAGHNRPYVTINAATTLDGRIATRSGDSSISSRCDLARVHRMRAAHDAVLVGVGTVLADDPLLTVRYARGPNPARVILDPAGRTPSGSRLLATCGRVPTLLVLTDRAGHDDEKRLEGAGVTIIREAGERILLGRVLENLYRRGIHTLLVEGGGRTIWGFVAEDVFDEIVLTVSPRLAGGAGTNLVGGEGFARITDGPELELASLRRQGGEVVLRYVRRPGSGVADGDVSTKGADS